MENELLAIGKVAALSGLPVSALRFYDGAGVLAPWRVDPWNGYRLYRPEQVAEARLLAHLRRVGLALDDIRTVVTDPAQAGPVLAGHLARLEAGLVDARREISIVHQLLDDTETTMTRCTIPATSFLGALREVRYAVGADPEQPRLHGVYLDSEPGGVRVVATDRFRLATSHVATADDVDLHLLLPTDAVDELLASGASGLLDVIVTDGRVEITGDGCSVETQVLDVDFPSYRSLLEHGHRQVAVDAVALRAALAREDEDVSTLRVGESGVHVGDTSVPGTVAVAVNRAFMLEALAAGDQLTLGIDDPIAPLAIRDAEREGSMSILMPVRLDQSA